MILEDLLTQETILILIGFVIFVAVSYKIFRILSKAVMIGIVSFSFPFVMSYLDITLPITILANVETGIQFAMIGVGLFIAYEFWHYIFMFLKIITWPVRMLFKFRYKPKGLDKKVKELSKNEN